jgi:hypothetical protein
VTLVTPALARVTQRVPLPDPSLASADEAPERCDLCAAPIAPAHRHLFDLRVRQVLCACTACRILFDQPAAGGQHFRLIPERREKIGNFNLDDVRWDQLRVPVNVAFFSYSSTAGRMVAMYPGALGAAESALALDTWRDLAGDNPVLAGLAPDVEALLVYRAREPHQHFVVPIDECYRLTGIIRTQWKGFTGGKEVWQEISLFFDQLSRRAVTVTQRI